jgi:hypothetical protein
MQDIMMNCTYRVERVYQRSTVKATFVTPPLGELRKRWMANTKIDLEEAGWNDI